MAGVLAWFQEQHATAAGGKWFAQLLAAVATLEKMPERCPAAAEADDLGVDIRELLVGKRHGTYRILFSISGKTVYVLRVWHGARDQVTRDDL